MNGMDMMISSVLKAVGFNREDFDKGVATAKEKMVEFEKRFEAIEARQIEILSILRNMHAGVGSLLASNIPRAADVQETDHAEVTHD